MAHPLVVSCVSVVVVNEDELLLLPWSLQVLLVLLPLLLS